MLIAVICLTILAAILGTILGFADKKFAVEGNPFIAELEAMLPGSNCGQCSYPGCAGAAKAIAEGEAPVTCCPPGGKALAGALAAKMGVSLDLSQVKDSGPQLAVVAEELCIGCCRCARVCPTDAIVGAAKQIHNILREACTGCGNCIEKCPTEALVLQPVPVTLQHWVWPKPTSSMTASVH